MTDQPPVQPSHQPSKTNAWRQATSTHGGRWAIAVAVGALGCLMLLGIAVAGLVVLRNHDRVSLVGQRQDGYSRGQDGPGNGRGSGPKDGNRWQQPGMPGGRAQGPGMPGGRAQGPGGFGSLPAGSALHGAVTAPVNGSVQALVFQRGEVTVVSVTSITLKSSDGFVGTYGRTAATISRGAPPVKGEQAFVLARASDKVAITTRSMRARVGAAPSN
ncbi:MAG: hypothetical protein IMZ75_17220 [Actinobacteria bacterium]|nr:hypothetical protein [Actinomycetota bacterium]